MRNTLILFLVFSNYSLTAQRKQTATQFDKFINLPGIEWAAYVDDTIRFDKVNFNKILVKRFIKKEIRASAPVSDLSNINSIPFSSREDIEKIYLFPYTTNMVIDTNGSIIKTVRYEIDLGASSLTDISQIIYVETKKIKSYVTWVSPKVVPLITSSGISLGTGDYFSSCFNFKYNYTPVQNAKKIYLSQTKKLIKLDTLDTENKLKELYGRNLIETLWPYILDSSIAVFSVEKTKKLHPHEIIEDLINNVQITVPVYDTLGNISSYTVPQVALSPKVFAAIELVQDWYYDYTKNIVFNTIREVYLYAKKWNNDIQEKIPSPILKIVFN